MHFSCNADAAIREYAAETGNFVLSASGYTPKENISKEWSDSITNIQADWAVGDSAIVAPGEEYIVPAENDATSVIGFKWGLLTN